MRESSVIAGQSVIGVGGAVGSGGSAGGSVCTRTHLTLAQIAARPVVYRPGVGLVEAPADWRERMNARYDVLVPPVEGAA